MGFELREHTADVAVAATGATVEDVFASAADGLAAACCEDVPGAGERFSFSVTAESREALLFDYLDELVYLRDVRGELPVDNAVAIEGPVGTAEPSEVVGDPRTGETGASESDAERWSLDGSARGVPLSAIAAREVKAVTYSEMRLEATPTGWEAYVVLDV